MLFCPPSVSHGKEIISWCQSHIRISLNFTCQKNAHLRRLPHRANDTRLQDQRRNSPLSKAKSRHHVIIWSTMEISVVLGQRNSSSLVTYRQRVSHKNLPVKLKTEKNCYLQSPRERAMFVFDVFGSSAINLWTKPDVNPVMRINALKICGWLC